MRFYVYELARPDGSVFYVGKGQGDRINQHERQAARGVRSYKCNIIRKIWRDGGEVQRRIVFLTDDEAAALAKEMELIARYGRKNLTNKTDGGDGVSNPAPEVRERMRSAAIERESRRTISEAELNAMSERAKALWRNPQWRDHAIAYRRTPEYHAKAQATRRAAWSNPEQRKRLIDGRRAATPRHAATMKALWADSQIREQMLAKREQTVALRDAGKSKICNIEGCDRKRQAKGLCLRCYKRVLRAEQKAARDALPLEERYDRSAAMIARYADPMERKKTGEQTRLWFARLHVDPDRHAKYLATQRTAHSKPGVNERKSASLKAMWSDPEKRAARLAAINQRIGERPILICAVEECEGKTYCKGLCSIHYNAARWKARKAQTKG